MEALSTIAEIIRDLLIFVAVLTALLVVLIVVVARVPGDNPLKRLLTALSYRIGATAAAGALAIPNRTDIGRRCSLRHWGADPTASLLDFVFQERGADDVRASCAPNAPSASNNRSLAPDTIGA